MRNKISMRRSRGFSLVEIAMVLAIAALIISGVMLFYQNANMSQIAVETQTEMIIISGAVHSLYSGVSSYAGLNDAIIYGSPDIPGKWKNSVSGTLQSPYHMPLSMVSVSDNLVFITIHNVPNVVCSKLVSSDPGPGSWWTVGGAVPVHGSLVGKAMTPEQAKVACGYPLGSSADLAYAIN